MACTGDGFRGGRGGGGGDSFSARTANAASVGVASDDGCDSGSENGSAVVTVSCDPTLGDALPLVEKAPVLPPLPFPLPLPLPLPLLLPVACACPLWWP